MKDAKISLDVKIPESKDECRSIICDECMYQHKNKDKCLML